MSQEVDVFFFFRLCLLILGILTSREKYEAIENGLKFGLVRGRSLKNPNVMLLRLI